MEIFLFYYFIATALIWVIGILLLGDWILKDKKDS